MAGWNLADLLEAVAETDPGAVAQTFVSGTGESYEALHTSHGELHQRANGIAQALLERGVKRQDKVAQYMFNRPEYFESVLACYKASLVAINTNYRYVEGELLYLWDNADVVAVVFEGTFTERIEGIRDQLPKIHTWLFVDDGSRSCPDWAIPYEPAAQAGRAEIHFEPRWVRDGDDLWFLYTGGTTGMPKGVMWRQDDLWRLANQARENPYDLSLGLEGLKPQLLQETGMLRLTLLPACPLMHGTGFLTAQGALLNGGRVVSMARRKFDPARSLEVIAREGVHGVAIVGDAFARPLLRALDSARGRGEVFDISSLVAITSSGAMWSREVKEGLLRHNPKMILRDALGSSESIGMGKSESVGEDASETASFEAGEHTCVLTEDGRKVEPGTGERGRIAVGGPIPLGYYKDPGKTAATFKVVDGERYSLAGDWATVESDGRIRLLGRAGRCASTPVVKRSFPEEVEEVLKRHAAVRDAVCVGIPDERFGQAVTGVVELYEAKTGAGSATKTVESELIGFVRESLAAYKAPKRVLFRESVGRAANGKADYNGLREWAQQVVSEGEK